MTLSSTTVKDTNSGDGSTTDFVTTFSFWNSSELQVILVSSTGGETTWTEGTEYDVTGGSGTTGTVSASTTGTDYTPGSSEQLIIQSNMVNIQSVSLTAGGQFPSTTVEQDLDKIVRMIQQLEQKFSRAPLLAHASTTSDLTLPNPSSGKVIGWSSGGGLTNLTV